MATVVNEELKGASRTKLDRANLALYARQVKAAERAAANAQQRIRVAQDQYEWSLFSLRSDGNDPLTAEFLALKRQPVIKRLRVEAPQEETIRHSDPELVSTAGGGRGAVPCDEQAHVVVTHTAQPVTTTCVAEINTTTSNATSDANTSQVV
ncbi:hypothetical protein DVH05_003338 [Phytophthora capsici]|nr:hypothetical protein DVH05_003338 [Phytophthora capsici]